MLNSYGHKKMCEGCSKYDLCTIRISGKDLEFCEDYEAKNYFNSRSVPISNSNTSESLINNIIINQPKGICKNCANLESCLYPRPEGGIWRCEEYE